MLVHISGGVSERGALFFRHTLDKKLIFRNFPLTFPFNYSTLVLMIQQNNCTTKQVEIMKTHNVSKSNEEGVFEIYEGQKMVYAPNGEVVKVECDNINGSVAVEFQDGSIEDVARNDLIFD